MLVCVYPYKFWQQFYRPEHNSWQQEFLHICLLPILNVKIPEDVFIYAMTAHTLWLRIHICLRLLSGWTCYEMMGLSESGCTATQDTAWTGLPRPKLQANNSNYVWQMEKIVKKLYLTRTTMTLDTLKTLGSRNK